MAWTIAQRALAEFVGTFVRVVAITGGVVLAWRYSVDFLEVDRVASLAIGFGSSAQPTPSATFRARASTPPSPSAHGSRVASPRGT
jgi:hypothetical protein